MNDRRVLLGLGVVVAVLAVVLTVVVVSGGGNSQGQQPLVGVPATAPAVTAATPAPPTTVTTPPTSTTPAPAPVTTTALPTVAVNVPLSGAGAVLAPPASPDVRTEDAPNDCASLVDGGWESIDCKSTATGPGGLTYVIEVLPMPSYVSTRALIFRQTPSGAEQVVLVAEDDSGTRYETGELEAAIVPITGANPVIAVGFQVDDGNVLAMDVVEQPGVVAAHEDLPDGAVVATPTGLETWAGPAQPGSGPYTHNTLDDVGGAWRVVARQSVPDDDVPHDRNLLA